MGILLLMIMFSLLKCLVQVCRVGVWVEQNSGYDSMIQHPLAQRSIIDRFLLK